MSKNVKIPRVSLSTVQPGEQIEQDEYYSTPDIYPSNGAQQFRAPLTPRLNGQPGEQIQQDECYLAPGVPPSNGWSPLKVPTTPFSSVQVTPKPGIPAIPAPGTPPAIIDPHTQQLVKDYADWLAKQAKYDVLNDNTQEINDYIQEATKVVKVGEKEVTMFAPFRPKLSALQTFTARQVVALCVIGLLWMIGLLVFRLEMLTAVIAAITVLYFYTLVLNVSLAIRSFRNSPEERISDDIVHALKNANWPLYTILCPLYREVQVVPQFVQAMLALDYRQRNCRSSFSRKQTMPRRATPYEH